MQNYNKQILFHGKTWSLCNAYTVTSYLHMASFCGIPKEFVFMVLLVSILHI